MQRAYFKPMQSNGKYSKSDKCECENSNHNLKKGKKQDETGDLSQFTSPIRNKEDNVMKKVTNFFFYPLCLAGIVGRMLTR